MNLQIITSVRNSLQNFSLFHTHNANSETLDTDFEEIHENYLNICMLINETKF